MERKLFDGWGLFITKDLSYVGFFTDDRATMLNLMVGLNGYTLCSGIICEELNGNDYAAVPLAESEKMRIGYIRHKGIKVSPIGELYVDILKKSGKPL